MIRGLGVSAPSDAGIWAGLPAGLQLAARKGSVPPGIGNASVQFDSLGLPAINGSGAVAFYGTMIGLGIGDQNNAGIWAGPPGALQLAARKGSGFLRDEPAQRWARQALFFLVWSCPAPVAGATIRDLAGLCDGV